MKIAIVHDYLAEYGGAERVVQALSETFPQAPIYVGFVDFKRMGKAGKYFCDKDIRTTFLQKIPCIKKLYSPLRILAPRAFAKLNLQEYDVVISSTNAYFAKAVRVRKDAVHFCYCHTPARSLYGYSTKSGWDKKPIISFLGKISNHFLRITDFNVAQKVTQFIANSKEVKNRIDKFYRRDSVIIYPPVQMVDKKFNCIQKKDDYYLYVNRLNYAKHPELAIKACKRLKKELIIVGNGEMLPYLQQIADENITFCGSVGDAELANLYSGANLLLYPVEDEDFGIVPIEAASFGVPVVAHHSGGPKETIIENKTGLFFEGDLNCEQDEKKNLDNFVKVIKKAEQTKWNKTEIIKHAQQFSKASFQKKIKELINIS